MARGGKFGWFLGLIFGTLFGVLFAPGKGKDLRARIKSERKKGKLGISPLQDDFKHVGRQIAAMAKNIYYSESVQDIVEKGRSKVKDLSDDFVGEVADFHKSRIYPAVSTGKKNLKKAAHEWGDLKKKVSTSAKIGKRALKDMKKVMKKKPA